MQNFRTRSHAHLLHVGAGYSMLIHLTLTQGAHLLEVSERLLGKKRLYGQPFYDPFQLRKEMALFSMILLKQLSVL